MHKFAEKALCQYCQLSDRYIISTNTHQAWKFRFFCSRRQICEVEGHLMRANRYRGHQLYTVLSFTPPFIPGFLFAYIGRSNFILKTSTFASFDDDVQLHKQRQSLGAAEIVRTTRVRQFCSCDYCSFYSNCDIRVRRRTKPP